MFQDTCPKCGASTTFGYGLAGEGVGAYVMCLECDYFEKEVEHPPETQNLIADAAEAQDLFGDDELERFAEEQRRGKEE